MIKATSPKTIPESVYLRHLQRSKNTLNYFTFFRPFFKILKRLDALFLQDLINLASIPSTVTKTIDGEDYFLCTETFLKDSGSNWSSDEQNRHLASIKKKGFVKARKMGLPARRWVHIELQKIEDAIDEKEGLQSPQGCGDWTPQPCGTKKEETSSLLNNKKKKARSQANEPFFSHSKHQTNRYHSPRQTLNGSPPHEEVSIALKLARKLFTASLAKNLVDPESSKIQKWEKEISPLVQRHSPAEVEQVLDWHIDPSRFGRQYYHKAYCAKEFVAKFLVIRAKMFEFDPLVTITRVIIESLGGGKSISKQETKQVRESELSNHRGWDVKED